MGLTKPIEQNIIKLSRYIYVSKDIIRGRGIMIEPQKIKVKITELSYLCFVAVMLFAKGIGLYDGLLLYKLFLVAGLGLVAVKMCVTEHTLKEWIVMILICLWVAFLYLNCKEKGIVICTLVILAMKDVSLDKVFRIGMWVWGITMCGNIVYHLINLDASGFKVHEKLGLGHIFRWDLGFSHPNVLHISYLVLSAFVIYNLGEKYNWKYMLILMFGNIYIFLYSVSYTGIIVTTLYLGVAWYVVIRKKLNRVEYVLMGLVYPICILMSFVSALFLPENFFEIVNKIFSNRLILAKHYLIPEYIRLMGNNLEQITSNTYTLDNAYLFCFIIYGVIFFGAILVAYLLLIHKFINMKRNKELAIIICFLIAGITEPFLFNTSFKNLTLFFLGDFLWENWKQNNRKQGGFVIFSKLPREYEIDVTKLYILKENLFSVWKNKWRKVLLLSGIVAVLAGTVWGINQKMPKGYIVPRVHATIEEAEKNLWCMENPEDSQYDGIKILGYVDDKTYMYFFEGNIVAMEQVRRSVSNVFILWILMSGIYMFSIAYKEQRKKEKYE